MRYLSVLILLMSAGHSSAQELFVYTEPASNMAARSIGLRANNYLMKDIHSDRVNYMLLPEIMWGLSRKVMLHAEGFLSNENGPLVATGASFYGKYRFFSIDEVHSHFRVAAFGRFSFNNSSIDQPAIDFYGRNSGYEGGLVATKLIRKFAVSASSSVLYAKDNGEEKFLYGEKNRTAINYTLSMGKLLLPKEYTSYGQTNLNFMLELLGQTTVGNGNSYLDLAPSLQLIMNSRLRVDLGYRAPLVSKLVRAAPRSFLFRIEYNIFNLY
jgi:hypothetical protein